MWRAAAGQEAFRLRIPNVAVEWISRQSLSGILFLSR